LPDISTKFTECVILCAALILTTACGRDNGAYPKRMIVLGVDGMDPGFVERHWADLPNLNRLRGQGSFMRLRTSTPPQSPVAWSTFITGTAPSKHGIFDFVHRNPATLAPFSSMNKTQDARFTLPFGKWRLPLSAPKILSLRKGTPYWKLLSDAGAPVTVLRMPTNYPPIEAGHAIAGMGVPDLRGTNGTFTFFTDDPEELVRSVPGGSIVKVHVENNRAILPLEGPPNAFRKDGRSATFPLVIDIDPDQPIARLTIGDHLAIVGEGEWSDWLVADFPLLPNLVSARGMFRVFARQLHPALQLYVSPVNVDPMAPVLPLSTPAAFSREVAQSTGRYHTLGIPEDTAALREGVFKLPQFLSQTQAVFEDERKLLRYGLSHFQGGLLFAYFSVVDQGSHILWDRHETELLDIYRAVDGCIGEVMRQEPAAELIVMSDHGFTTFTRAVHLNTWLYNRGFLALTKAPGEETNIVEADWRSTEAYALGLNGLYMNLAGREKNGIIPRGERSHALIDSLREQLLAFRDPVNGANVVGSVDLTDADSANSAVAPDLIVGYNPGYRGSWQTGLGGAPREEIVANNDAWIGDHCVNPANVPGVLFTSKRIPPGTPALQDITALILRSFGVTSHE
jgi:predicted AlkP superfamily phosphohydrolase/phosphomutase